MISIDRLHDMAIDEFVEEDTKLIQALESIREIAIQIKQCSLCPIGESPIICMEKDCSVKDICPYDLSKQILLKIKEVLGE